MVLIGRSRHKTCHESGKHKKYSNQQWTIPKLLSKWHSVARMGFSCPFSDQIRCSCTKKKTLKTLLSHYHVLAAGSGKTQNASPFFWFTRNVGPRSWFEYGFWLFAYTTPPFFFYSMVPNLPLTLLVALRSCLPRNARYRLPGECTNISLSISPYSVFPRKGLLRNQYSCR